MGIFSILAGPLSIIMRFLYGLVGNYGWAIIIFTLVTKLVMFPLGLKQQKSTAKMAAYQPMIKEIQKKWAGDKTKQNQEVQKFYEENNIKMSAGCAPMLINMLVLFGVIGVIQAPINYILEVPQLEVEKGISIVKHYQPDSPIASAQQYTLQSLLVGEVKNNPDMFLEGFEDTIDGEKVKVYLEEDIVRKIETFNFHFLGIDLSRAPSLGFNRYLVLPILSLLSMVGSQLIIMKTSGGQQGQGQMMLMTLAFSGIFAFMAFRNPVGFSLYYTISNILQTVQQLIVKRIHDPLVIRQQVEKEIEERRAQKKAKKKVTVRMQGDDIVEMDVNDAELAKLRLERARLLDAARYGIEDESSEEELAKLEKARQKDKEAEDKQAKTKKKKPDTQDALTVEFEELGEGDAPQEQQPPVGENRPAGESAGRGDEKEAENTEKDTINNEDEGEKDAPAPQAGAEDEKDATAENNSSNQGQAGYKPGRRRRAGQAKSKNDTTPQQATGGGATARQEETHDA